SIAGAIFLFAGASWVMMPGSSEPQATGEVATAADPMPTASTGSDEADVAVTTEPMTDDQKQQAANAEPATDETAGTGLDGLTALIESEVPTAKPTGTATTAPAQESQMASAGDVKLTPDGREFGSKDGGTRLMLKAKAPVWVRIEDSQGNVVM